MRFEPTLLRKMNERRVLEVIQQRGPSSRATVTKVCGLSAPTVSKAVAELLRRGLLEEDEVAAAALGRPAKLLRLPAQTARVLGVVIDARRSWVVSAGLNGQLIDQAMVSFATPANYPQLLDAIVAHAEGLMRSHEGIVHGIGLSVPGLVNQRLNEVVLCPNLHALDGRQPAHDLSERLGLQCLLLQESHSLCLGERMYGEAKGLDDFAMLDVSTGLGLGVMSGGRLLTGNSGLAGELGHVTVDPDGTRCGCGNRGCLETLATDSALARMLSTRLGRSIEIDEIVEAVRAGTLDASAELERVARYLAIAVAAVVNIFNPSTLFVHGRLFETGDDLYSQMLAHVRGRALMPSLADCRIVQARGSKRQGAVAGIIHHLTHSLAPALAENDSDRWGSEPWVVFGGQAEL